MNTPTSRLTRIKTQVAIHAHRKVSGLLDGEYLSTQLGRSMEFHDLREYVRGDDVKDIDWKATARTGELLVKRFVALRQHTLLIAVSTGDTMAAQATAEVSKRDLAVFAAGVLGWIATRHGDKVGFVLGDSRRQEMTKPSEREVALERSLAQIDEMTTPDAAPPSVEALLRHIARRVRTRSILIVISDEHTVSAELAAVLRRLQVQHELLFLTVDDADPTLDPGERGAYDIGARRALPAWLRDDLRLREEYRELAASERREMQEVLDRMGIAHERVLDERSALGAVFRLLERHRHAGR